MDRERRAVLRSVAQLALLALPGRCVARDRSDVRNDVRSDVRRDVRSDVQPLAAQARRVIEAFAFLGEPFAPDALEPFTQAERSADDTALLAAIERLFGGRCLADVRINPEGRVSIERGPAEARLVEQGWRAFLVKVRNEAGVTTLMALESPQARPVYRPGTGTSMAPKTISAGDIADRWLALEMFVGRPLEPQLSGLPLEYRIAMLYSRDRGRREAQIGAITAIGSADIGFRNRVAILFQVDPAETVTFALRDEHGRPAVAALQVEDAAGRIYPARSKRLAPDFFFQPHVYRADGESMRLPPGEYTITCSRGPEYAAESKQVRVTAGRPETVEFRLSRWIDPASMGWYSGDHHIHAAGCSHYESPTEGVRPEDMMRHVLGEGLAVGAVLNWGPGYYHQRQYFEAREHALSTASTKLRYDLEVSGFPSSHCGHLVLLRLRDQDYPDARQIEDWPSWDLPILSWAKAQGAVTGFAHTGWGLQVASRELPNYEIPPFDGIGANEFIVDVTHDVVDFISAVDTPFVHELNIWYHTLNCGYRTRVSGETDFPCITDYRVGGGRSYVKLPSLTYDGWCDGIRSGRTYVSDGRTHLMDFAVDRVVLGEGASERPLDRAATVVLTARAACLLPAAPPAARPDPGSHPYWTPEHARVAGTRQVTVEAIVNGRPVASQRIEADGGLHDIRLEARIERSSWIALRVLGAAHTNPIFVPVGGRPVRASKRSAQWCLAAVDRCWSQKVRAIRSREREAAERAYEHARRRYRAVADESEAD